LERAKADLRQTYATYAKNQSKREEKKTAGGRRGGADFLRLGDLKKERFAGGLCAGLSVSEFFYVMAY